MLKKFAAAAAAALMVLTLACISYAASPDPEYGGTTADGFEYVLIDGGSAVSVTGYRGKGGDVVIPGSIDGRPVTEINDYCFSYSARPVTVSIPATVHYIGESAFRECTRLESIEIPAGVTEIQDDTFSLCASLRDVVLPSGITEIGDRAFRGCSSLVDFRMPPRAAVLGRAAFAGCRRIANADLPEGLKEITSGLFRGCISLRNVRIPGSVRMIGSFAFSSCTALEKIAVPSGVTQIGRGAFSECRSLTTVELPDTLQGIDSSAFEACSALERLDIPPGVTSVGNAAFAYCSAMKILAAGPSLDEAGNNAFAGIALETLEFSGTRTQWNSSILKRVLNPEPSVIHYTEYELPVPYPDTGWSVSECVDGPVLTGIKAGCADSFVSVADLCRGLTHPAGIEPEIAGADGVEADAGMPVSTGMRIMTGGEPAMTVVVSGDVLGTGLMSLSQVIGEAEAFTGRRMLEGPYLAAGCFTGDKLTITDVVIMAQMYRSTMSEGGSLGDNIGE